ncbi:hypothetical protein AB3X91_09215 [Paraburkholderia sp. BR14263]|uniref:hypothetical protein n=1 Tax=unclassified Paraburkholderia TaxID=2615204 RepID=UPI0034CD3E3D
MLYADVDALCKLAHWNVLPHLPELTSFPWDSIATVTSLRFRAQRCMERPDGKLFHSTDAAAEVITHMKLMAAATAPDPDILAELSGLSQIDEGEAVLLSLTMGDPEGIFLTGDKRALRGLAHHRICPRFSARVLVLEQILAQCLRKYGREWVSANFCPHKHIDKSVSAILGSRCDATIESMLQGVRSYLSEIRRLHNPEILYPLGDMAIEFE